MLQDIQWLPANEGRHLKHTLAVLCLFTGKRSARCSIRSTESLVLKKEENEHNTALKISKLFNTIKSGWHNSKNNWIIVLPANVIILLPEWLSTLILPLKWEKPSGHRTALNLYCTSSYECCGTCSHPKIKLGKKPKKPKKLIYGFVLISGVSSLLFFPRRPLMAIVHPVLLCRGPWE